jgi:hypothetical protein
LANNVAVVLADGFLASKGPKDPDGPLNKAIVKDVATILCPPKKQVFVKGTLSLRSTEPVLKELTNERHIACLVGRAKDAEQEPYH